MFRLQTTTRLPRAAPLALLVLLVFGYAGATAQERPDPIELADSLSHLVHSGAITGDTATLQAARTLAERALYAHDGHPLLEHHLAESYYREASLRMADDRDAALTLLEKADRILEAATERDDALPETHALRASVLGMRITNPVKGMTLGPKASRALDRAEALAPDNPRVWLARGISTLHTPGFMGGGADAAIAELRRGVAALGGDDPDPGHPIGGGAELWAWIGIAQLRADRPVEAATAFRRALEIEPEFGWVRYLLLPEAESEISSTGSPGRIRPSSRMIP
jgi:tetratricopeptide (TPR) repeat protein